MRIAIVGFGPKGLFALERLLDHAAALPPQARLEIDLYEPDPNPGAGPNYAPDQPAYLRMNFAAELIDMWWPDSRAVPRSAQRPFVRWRSAGSGAGAAYPPRAEVGEYLSAGFESLLRYAPLSVTVRLRETAVDAVRARGDAWDVYVADGVAGTYDEVLLATGHQPPAPGAAGVFPVARWLTPDRIAPGARVAIRGFGLTFIDAALALTEGRGSSFRATGHPYRLSYEPGADAVALIVPFSRTGRPVLAKPGTEITVDAPELGTIAARERAVISSLAGDVALQEDLLPILARASDASLLAVGHAHGEDSLAWFTAAAAGRRADSGLSPLQEIERSLAVGAGLSPPDLLWAVGHTWRALYPAIVARLGDGGLRAQDWPAFHRLAAELERVAFGPSPFNAAKLVALVEAGVVDLARVAGGSPEEGSPDVVVDAVLPGPGVLPGRNALLDGLIADGHARTVTGRRGLDVDADGSCRSRDGSASIGLAAIGRPTEDAVIGNDTLSRTLHPLSDRWARRVVGRASA